MSRSDVGLDLCARWNGTGVHSLAVFAQSRVLIHDLRIVTQQRGPTLGIGEATRIVVEETLIEFDQVVFPHVCVDAFYA